MKTCTEPDIRRFYTYVAVAGPDKCWDWIGARDRKGYGQFWFGGETIKAHRFAWWIATGVWPEDLLVCHHCDNPECCNPAHLWIGTAKDNTQDAVAKGRTARGERHGSAKLTEAAVCDIRERYDAGDITQRQLASEYGVSIPLISQIVRREIWVHVQ